MSGGTALINRDLMHPSAVGTNTVDITVTPGKRWLVHGLAVRYVATADVGNRLMRAELVIDGVVCLAVETAAAITASQTAFVAFGHGTSRDASDVGLTIVVPLPELIALPGDIIRVRDSAGINAGDVITVFAFVDVEADL